VSTRAREWCRPAGHSRYRKGLRGEGLSRSAVFVDEPAEDVGTFDSRIGIGIGVVVLAAGWCGDGQVEASVRAPGVVVADVGVQHLL
jgi:hypothetical protein